jgi:hypothetical protein
VSEVPKAWFSGLHSFASSLPQLSHLSLLLLIPCPDICPCISSYLCLASYRVDSGSSPGRQRCRPWALAPPRPPGTRACMLIRSPSALCVHGSMRCLPCPHCYPISRVCNLIELLLLQTVNCDFVFSFIDSLRHCLPEVGVGDTVSKNTS